MTRIARTLALVAVLVPLALAGCAAPSPPLPRDSQPPRVRCLTDPHETGTRPLFFFFCIESP
jgi:hypothetical protein